MQKSHCSRALRISGLPSEAQPEVAESAAAVEAAAAANAADGSFGGGGGMLMAAVDVVADVARLRGPTMPAHA